MRGSLTVYSISDLKKYLSFFKDKPTFRICYRPMRKEERKGKLYIPDWNDFWKVCYSYGNMSVYIDEANQLCQQASPDFLNAVLTGRHRNLSMTFVSQRITSLSTTIRENADEFVLFHTAQPRSLELIDELCGNAVASRVKTLAVLNQKSHPISSPECLTWSASNASYKIQTIS